MISEAQKQGFDAPGDQKVPVPARDWNAMKLALWRSKVGWEIVAREAAGVLERCAHMEGCAGKEVETEPCLRDCPDRELRMSALVILNTARGFTPVNARKPADPYFAPSREYFSEVIAELAAAQAELAELRPLARAQASAQPPPAADAASTFVMPASTESAQLKEAT